MIKIELQKLINRWEKEVDLIVKIKAATSTNHDMFTICLARANQLRDCINQVELLLSENEPAGGDKDGG